MLRVSVFGAVLSIALMSSTFAAVKNLSIIDRSDLKKGASFANAGAYERIRATATYGGGVTANLELLRPRDLTKGNGTLIYLANPGPNEQTLMEAGFTILKIDSNPPEAIRDVLDMIRYGDSTALLGDGAKMVKRFIGFGSTNAKVLSYMAKQGFAVNANKQNIFDVFWFHETDEAAEPISGTKVHITSGKPIDALALQLNEQITRGM